MGAHGPSILRLVRDPDPGRSCDDRVVGPAVGIDLVQVARMARNVERPGFLKRAFTPAEQRLCAGDPARLAGRWAAKEAAMKALGRGIGELPMTDLEVLAEPSGAPRLLLSGAAAAVARSAGWTAWSVSISHDGEYATAVVVAERHH
jgi:holo-[acyl-carrier protein] synthase